MTFSLFVTAEHSGMIAAVLEEHYQAHGIDTSAARADAEFFAKVIFVNGIQKQERLKAALETRQKGLMGRTLAGRSHPVTSNSP